MNPHLRCSIRQVMFEPLYAKRFPATASGVLRHMSTRKGQPVALKPSTIAGVPIAPRSGMCRSVGSGFFSL
jgi:hypothetical protein